jgi:hypothetical protein
MDSGGFGEGRGGFGEEGEGAIDFVGKEAGAGEGSLEEHLIWGGVRGEGKEEGKGILAGDRGSRGDRRGHGERDPFFWVKRGEDPSTDAGAVKLAQNLHAKRRGGVREGGMGDLGRFS